MKKINITEFRKNMKKYSDMVKGEDLEIEKNGKPVFILTSLEKERVRAFNRLCGSLQTDLTYDEILSNRVNEL